MDMSVNGEARQVMGAKYQQMVEYSEEDVEKYLDDIRNALLSKKILQMVRPAHTIKSNSRSLGLARMADLAAAFEAKARAMSDGRMSPMFDDLTRDFEAIEHCFEKSRSLLSATDRQGASRQA